VWLGWVELKSHIEHDVRFHFTIPAIIGDYLPLEVLGNSAISAFRKSALSESAPPTSSSKSTKKVEEQQSSITELKSTVAHQQKGMEFSRPSSKSRQRKSKK
jgi:hypothetical protein